jgi:phenylacetate-CoA ligase
MHDFLLRMYRYLPASARSAAASVYGAYLRSWRYGAETERLEQAALEREQWSAEQWMAWRQERLAYVLHRAATSVPYYREQWAARRRRGDRASWEYLENWPVLEKEPLRTCPAALVADDCDVRRMFREHTSGTTGKPIVLWRSRETTAQLYALAAVRTRAWYGLARKDRWATLAGQLIVPVHQRKPPFWVWNAALKQLYMSSYHLAPDLISYYLDALARYRIGYLCGYSSSLHALAHETLELGRRDLQMAVVISNAEPIPEHQRQVIAEAFQCPVRETYGMAEIVVAASECQEGRLHQWPEVGWIEVLDSDDQGVSDGDRGELVCTGLLNADMPLIRYRTGDCGRLTREAAVCRCGRTLPTIAGIDGRTNDLLITGDGRRVYCPLSAILHGVPVRHAQVVQVASDRLLVHFVPAQGFTGAAGRLMVERLQERLGPMHVTLEPVAEVPRSANGKFRAVMCSIPAAQRSLAR